MTTIAHHFDCKTLKLNVSKLNIGKVSDHELLYLNGGHTRSDRRGGDSVVVCTSAWQAAGQGSISRQAIRHVIRCKNLAINIRDCLSLCLSE